MIFVAREGIDRFSRHTSFVFDNYNEANTYNEMKYKIQIKSVDKEDDSDEKIVQ